jgi:peptidoglycan/xylan/chitin deacetylase (PgdA/CDA1 family)
MLSLKMAAAWFREKFSYLRSRPVPEPITVLMPCKDQKKELFLDALGSLVRQTSPHWIVLVLVDPTSPQELAEWASSFQDERIQFVRCPHSGFARALNYGLNLASTSFVSILLSDDRYSPRAITTLLAYRSRFPGADFFHSARQLINLNGDPCSGVQASRAKFRLEDFQRLGSPVKHLLCWRREKALQIGGMDETLSVHGCDDYDFPWRMAEAGAAFQSVTECLYEYRVHHVHSRLTTTIPVEQQIQTIRAMFARHGVASSETDRYVQRAIGGYLVSEFTDQIEHNRGSQLWIRCFYEAKAGTLAAFCSAGFKERHWFPHRVYVLPKGGPDGLKLAERMAGVRDPRLIREFVLYALPPVPDEFPHSLFFDDELQWHQQQFGLSAQVACANVIRGDGYLRCYTMISDLVQRISRAPLYRTRIDNRFKGWNRLLLNAILSYAAEHQMTAVYLPTSKLVLQNTDPRRNPQPALYERIYDRTALRLGATLEGDWWRLDVKKTVSRIVPLGRGFESDQWGKTVCITHDVERGIGHRDTHPEFALQAEKNSPDALRNMLRIEERLGVRATYHVVGALYGEIQEPIRSGRHAIAFHSYDHRIPGDVDGTIEQLELCRQVDYRLKGYRTPQSEITPGLTDANLAHFNFEWLASSRSSLKAEVPWMSDGIVKIPVHLDDYPMFQGRVSFAEWEREFWELVDSRDFVVIGLHDCYADCWLPYYEDFLHRALQRSSLMTLDEVAAGVTLGHARWFE